MSHHREALARLAVPVGQLDHAQGPEAASVTLVEYGDYECPFCGEVYPIIKEIQTRLGRQLRFVFRNFPLATAHPHAERAAEAAGAKGQFWVMHDVLFENQDALDDESLVQYATALGLNESKLARELAEHAYARRVREDFMGGVHSGVNGTPTFFINGVRHDGPFDLQTLFGAIKDEMGEVADQG
jgi:protein-disulfide isomerase